MASAPRSSRPTSHADCSQALTTRPAPWSALAGVRGVARIDFLSDGESLFVNEVNTIPGSLARYLWVDPPCRSSTCSTTWWPRRWRGPPAHYSAAGADGTVLRSAGSIAGKLG